MLSWYSTNQTTKRLGPFPVSMSQTLEKGTRFKIDLSVWSLSGNIKSHLERGLPRDNYFRNCLQQDWKYQQLFGKLVYFQYLREQEVKFINLVPRCRNGCMNAFALQRTLLSGLLNSMGWPPINVSDLRNYSFKWRTLIKEALLPCWNWSPAETINSKML